LIDTLFSLVVILILLLHAVDFLHQLINVTLQLVGLLLLLLLLLMLWLLLLIELKVF